MLNGIIDRSVIWKVGRVADGGREPVREEYSHFYG
jgi:hypothetical protein